jgi:hypothetical protein
LENRGLLLLYPLDPRGASLYDAEIHNTTPFIGSSIHFPASDTERKVSYTVPEYYLQMLNDEESDEIFE